MLGIITGSGATVAGVAGTAGIIALISTGWIYLKQGFSYISSLIITSVEMDRDLTAAVISYSSSNKIRSPLGVKYYSGHNLYVHPKRATETVVMEVIKNNMSLIKHGKGYALLFIKSNDISLKSIRGCFDVEGYMLAAVEHYNSKIKRIESNYGDKPVYKRTNSRFKMVRIGHCENKFSNKNSGDENSKPVDPSPVRTNQEIVELIQAGIFRLLRWNQEDLVTKPEEGQTPFTGYPFPAKVHSAIKDLECWIKNEKWFRSRSIPWKRGWLLHGQPGTGKSTLTKAIGMAFDLPIFIFDLNGMTNEELTDKWDNMVLANTPCIVLIEDIDNVFHGRTYVGAKTMNSPHLTFDCLLNCISGIKQSDGVCLIITTNHLDKVDSALGIPNSDGVSSRPGRVDKVIELGLMESEQRIQLANHILSDFPELIDSTVIAGEGETAAQFQNRCGNLALSKFWENKDSFINKEIPKYVEVAHVNTPKVAYAIAQPKYPLDVNG